MRSWLFRFTGFTSLGLLALACSHLDGAGGDAGGSGAQGPSLGGMGVTTGGTLGGGGTAPAGNTSGGSNGGVNSAGQGGSPAGGVSSGGSAGSGATAAVAGTSSGGQAGAGTSGAAGTAGAPVVGCKGGAPTPPGDGANFPFPQRRFKDYCTYPTTCSDEDVRVGWENYKARLIVDGGEGTLRVQRPEFGNDTVSEGIAYGMLFAVYMNEKETFDKIWEYAKKHMDGNGLMHWKIRPDGSVEGGNSATDADEDMAFALVMADKQWGGYESVAKDLLNKIKDHDFHGDGTIRGGDNYDDVNPSYLAPAFYRTFAAYTGDMQWMKILDKSYEILNGAAHPTTGLVPDWSSGSRGPDYTYDAARTPYRIALDACWNNEPRAKAYVEKVGNFFAGVGVENIRDKISLDGQITGEHHNSTFVGPAGTAGMVSNHVQLIDETYAFVTNDLREGTENYYNLSWALFTAMLMTGNFSDFTQP